MTLGEWTEWKLGRAFFCGLQTPELDASANDVQSRDRVTMNTKQSIPFVTKITKMNMFKYLSGLYSIFCPELVKKNWKQKTNQSNYVNETQS